MTCPTCGQDFPIEGRTCPWCEAGKTRDRPRYDAGLVRLLTYLGFFFLASAIIMTVLSVTLVMLTTSP